MITWLDEILVGWTDDRELDARRISLVGAEKDGKLAESIDDWRYGWLNRRQSGLMYDGWPDGFRT